MNCLRTLLTKEESIALGWVRGRRASFGVTCAVCQSYVHPIWSDNSTTCSCGWKPGEWPRSREEQDAFQERVQERGCRSIKEVRDLFQQERSVHQTVIINLPPDTETDLKPPTFTPLGTATPKIMGREFKRDEDGDWWLAIGIIDIFLKPHADGSWEWIIDANASEETSLENCLDSIGRELRFLRRELGLDIHQQTGIDSYAIHLGRQAANGLILDHETKWLEEYDRRRIHERKP